MRYIRQAQKRALPLWTLVLSLSILCAQGVKLHVHGFEHDHGSHHHDMLDGGYSDHAHSSEIHFANDKSHIDHHGGVIPEMDLSPDGLLKKVSNSVLVLALLTALPFLLLPGVVQQTCTGQLERKTTLTKRYIHCPPLRAPPTP